jgi:hypothetical protein
VAGVEEGEVMLLGSPAEGPKKVTLANMGKQRTPRTDTELEQTAKDVNYEIQMLMAAASHLGGEWSSPRTTLEDAHRNMALECFLLHYRNLRAFLCPSLQRVLPDDILGSDFLGKTSPEDVADPLVIGDDKERLDQMLAHLSYNRRTEYIAKCNYKWPVPKMGAAMLQEVDAFLQKLPERMKPWFVGRTNVQLETQRFQSWGTHSLLSTQILRPEVEWVSASPALPAPTVGTK